MAKEAKEANASMPAGLMGVSPVSEELTPVKLRKELGLKVESLIAHRLVHDHLTPKYIHAWVEKYGDARGIPQDKRDALEITLYQHVLRSASAMLQGYVENYFIELEYLSKESPRTPPDIMHRLAIYKTLLTPFNRAKALAEHYKEEFSMPRIDIFAPTLLDYAHHQITSNEQPVTYKTASGEILANHDIQSAFMMDLLKKPYEFTIKLLEIYTLNKTEPNIRR